MSNTEHYSKVIETLTKLAESNDQIRCCFLFGSRAQATTYADKWSDLDVAIICKNPNLFIDNEDWLKSFDKYIFAFKEAVSLGVGMQIRVLFENFFDVDFGFFSEDQFRTVLKDTRFYHGVIGRGIIKIIDKDGLLDFVQTANFLKRYYTPEINQDSLVNNVDDFLYHAISCVKKLHKNEILTAKDTLDSSMKNILMLFIRWYTMSKDKNIDTWHRNRHFEKWADIKIVNRLGNLYSIYNKYDIYEKVIVNVRCFEKFKIVLEWINENEPE